MTVGLMVLEKKLSLTGLIIIAVGLFQITLFIYYPSLKGGFIFDDFYGIVHNDDLRSPVNLGDFFGDHKNSIEFDRRPISGIVMMTNYQLTGPSPAGFRLVNIVLHFLIAVSWFVLLRKLAAEFASQLPKLFGLVCSAIWLVHPLGTSATSYCYQRIEMLLAFFLIWSLFFFVKSRTSTRPGLMLIASFLCAIACALSKEIGLAVLPSLAIVHLSLARKNEPRQKPGIAKNHLGYFYVALIAVFVGLGIWFSTGVRMTELAGGELATPWGYFKYESFVLLRYLSLVFWPHPLIFFSTPGEVPTFVEAFPALACLTIFFTYLIWKGFKNPWLWIPVGVFLSVLGPTSSFFPIHHEPEVDFRMYFPSMAIIVLAVVFGLPRLAEVLSSLRGLVGVIALVVIALGFGTWKRNQVFGRVDQVWLSVLEYEPNNEKALDNLGYWYLETERFEEARACGNRLLEISQNESIFGGVGMGLKLIGRIDLERQDFEKAQIVFERLEAANQGKEHFGVELAHAALGLRQFDRAEETLRSKSLRFDSSDLRVKAMWHMILYHQGERKKAQVIVDQLTESEKKFIEKFRSKLIKKEITK